MTDDIRYLALGEVTKTWDVSDGVMFEGRIGGPTLDMDDQYLDKDYLDTAVPKWAATGGNFRVMHQSVAAGKASSIEDRGDAWWTVGKVVDPIEGMKLKAGLYTGLSVGIKNGVVVEDKVARNGRIIGGDIVEVSLVDRPCDPANTLALKSAAMGEIVEADLAEDIVKRDFNASDRKRLASEGKALPDGSFPIENEEDLHNAVRLAGHATDKAAAKKHIIARAKAMGATGALPEDWNADAKKFAFEELVVQAAEDPELLALLKKIVAPELEKGTMDTTPTTEPSSATEPAPVAAVEPTKAAEPTEPAPVPENDLTKFVTADSLKVTLADVMKASLSEALKPLEERVAEMEKRAAPGGPALVKRQFDAPEDIQKMLLQKRVDSLKGLLNHPDPRVASDAYSGLQALGQ